MSSSQVDLATAQALVNAGIEAAGGQGMAMAVVVTDLGGHVVASARMDGAGFMMGEVARRKAITSATFGAPTHMIAEMAKQDSLLADAFTGVEQIVVLGGGFPIVADGRCVGGLGISGGHYAQDQAVGEAALAAAGGS